MQRFIFMYNNFDGDDSDMFKYVKDFFGDKVMIKSGTHYQNAHYAEGNSLWVSEDVYDYVFSTFNSHAVYDQEEFEIKTIQDSIEWKNVQIEHGLVTY